MQHIVLLEPPSGMEASTQNGREPKSMGLQ